MQEGMDKQQDHFPGLFVLFLCKSAPFLDQSPHTDDLHPLFRAKGPEWCAHLRRSNHCARLNAIPWGEYCPRIPSGSPVILCRILIPVVLVLLR